MNYRVRAWKPASPRRHDLPWKAPSRSSRGVIRISASSDDDEPRTPDERSADAQREGSTQMTTTSESSYGAKDITVLEGLEAVRKRPGMYIGSTGPTGLHHLVWEVVDNSVDEAMAGHCSRIDVTLTEDGACEVTDDGRGIPVETHPQYDTLSAAEVVLTFLHAGGKFGGEGYKVSGGLHGVGVSVVNALSERVEVEIDRDGVRHEMLFGDGGELKERLHEVGDSPVGDDGPHTGTTVRFWPDPTIFDEVDFRFQTLIERFQMMAFLNKGLEIRVRDLRIGARLPDGGVRSDADGTGAGNGWTIFKYDGGIIDFVSHVNASKEALFSAVGLFRRPGGHRRQRPRGRDRVPVEHGVQLRRDAQLRQRHRHDRGGHARAGLPYRSHPHGQCLCP